MDNSAIQYNQIRLFRASFWCCCMFSCTVLLPFVINPAEALAEPIVSAVYNNQGSFSITGNNMNRITEVELRISYQSEDPTPPAISSSYLDRTTQTAGSPGLLILPLKSSKPLSGYVSLAIVRIRGKITFITAVMRHGDGVAETARVSITNPTDEQLDGIAEKLAKKNQTTKSDATDKPTAPDTRDSASPPASPTQSGTKKPATPPTVGISPGTAVTSPYAAVSLDNHRSRKKDNEPQPLSFSRRKSLFERFNASSDKRTIAMLANLLQNNNESDLVQEPQLVLSDGISALRLTVRLSGKDTQSLQFLISGGTCTGLEAGEDSAWFLKIIPERGTPGVSVTVLADNNVTEYPLAVAPPIETFDAMHASPGLAEFVTLANEFVRSGGAASGIKKQ